MIFSQHRQSVQVLACNHLCLDSEICVVYTTAVVFYKPRGIFIKILLYNERQKVKVKIAHMSMNEILVTFIFKIWIVDIMIK